MMEHQRRTLTILAVLGALPNLVAFVHLTDWQVRFSIVASAGVSVFGFWATLRLIPTVQRLTLRRGLYGKAGAVDAGVMHLKCP